MPIAASARVHPTALVDPRADIGEDVEIGPYVVIEGEVCLGAACVVKMGAHLIGPLTMGCHNQIFSHAVLGDAPQHLKYNGEATRLEIGDHNIIREHVTIHRGTTQAWVTRVGSHNFFMVNSHIGHDCVVGNRCMFANGALLGGHVIVGDNVLISGNSAVHQWCRIGRLALLSGLSGTSKDMPPFIIGLYNNHVVGVNVIGMRRAGIPGENIDAVRRAFLILYRQHLTVPQAVARLQKELGHVPEVNEMVEFITTSSRGIILAKELRLAA